MNRDDIIMRPEVLEADYTAPMRELALRIPNLPEIQRALVAAEQLKPGYVIADETQAAEAADLVAAVINGERALFEEVQKALRIPKAIEAVVRGATAPAKDRLGVARQVGNAARVMFQATLRRRAAEAAEKARQAAQEAARRAAEEAAVTGEDAPPPAEIAPIEVPRTVAGGTGKMGTMVTIVPVEIVDYELVPEHWLELVPARARADFAAAASRNDPRVDLEVPKKPLPGESTIWQGVRFEARESAVNRR